MATRNECERAIALYESALLEFKNVESVGIVEEQHATDAGATAPNAGSLTANYSVAILVCRKIPYGDLEEDDLLPSYLQLVDALKGVLRVKTRVIERGNSVK